MDNRDLRLELNTIDTSSLVDKVEMRLIEVFIYKELKPGGSIPKETELVSLLKKGTPDEFREGMRRHLENHFVRILAETSGHDASK